MKTKIFGIFIMTLLIATAIPAVGITISKTQPVMRDGVLDQSQERSDECKWFQDAWQEFVPVGKKLLHVEVKIKQGYESSPDLIMYIEDSSGSPLVSLDKQATDIPDVCDWVVFDIDDVELVPGDTYRIHLKFDPGGEYAWCGANGDPYPAGDSDLGAQWDWCFRTYVDKSKSNNIKPISIKKSIQTAQSSDVPEWANGNFTGVWGINALGEPLPPIGWLIGYYGSINIGRFVGAFGEFNSTNITGFIGGIFFGPFMLGGINVSGNETVFVGLGGHNETHFYWRIMGIVGPTFYMYGIYSKFE